MFEITHNKKVLFGEGSVAEIENILKGAKISKVFFITYSQEAPVLSDILAALNKAGASAYICDLVQDEPDLTVVDRLVLLIKEQKCDAVIALGGGSVLDAAKAAAMIATNGATTEEYQMQGRAITIPALPLIAIPTTAGTGSEATKVSVIYNASNNLKKSFYSPHMIAEIVILDPAVTLALPAKVTAFTGIDALSHAIESYVSLNANVYTQMYSLKAIELIGKSITTAANDSSNVAARADMLYASYFAGVALHAGIGLAHIIAQPMGGLYKIPHGEACSIFLPYSMEFNLELRVKEYCDIGRALGLQLNGDTVQNARATIDKVKELIASVNTATTLTPYLQAAGVKLEGQTLDETVDFVTQATVHIKCNPRMVDSAAIKDVISKAL